MTSTSSISSYWRPTTIRCDKSPPLRRSNRVSHLGHLHNSILGRPSQFLHMGMLKIKPTKSHPLNIEKNNMDNITMIIIIITIIIIIKPLCCFRVFSFFCMCVCVSLFHCFQFCANSSHAFRIAKFVMPMSISHHCGIDSIVIHAPMPFVPVRCHVWLVCHTIPSYIFPPFHSL